MIKNREKIQTLFCIMIFIILSGCMTFPFIHTGNLQIINDGAFHLQRMEEIYLNLKHGHLSYITSYTFNHMGIASFLFYPSVFLYPWAALRFIFKPITAFYLGFTLIIFFTFIISFYCMKKFSNNNIKRSFIFALIYTIASKHITEFARFQFGEFIAYMFVPIAFLGFYQVTYQNRKCGIINLAIGMTLLAYSHLLSLYLVTIIMIILAFIQIVRTKRIKELTLNLFKSIGIFLLLSCWQFIPFITDYFNGNIATPRLGFRPPDSVENLWFSSWKNQLLVTDSSIGILLIIILVFGWIAIDKNAVEEWIYILGVIFTVFSTALIPWNTMQGTVLYVIFNVLQFSFRFLPIAAFFLSITGSLLINKMINKISKNKNVNNFLMVILTILIVTTYFQTISPLIKNLSNVNINYLAKSNTRSDKLPDYSIVNNQTYKNLNSYVPPIGASDYVLKQAFENQNSISMQNNEVIIGNKIKRIIPKCFSNKIIYTVYANKNQNVDVPVVKYKTSIVKLNGKSIDANIGKRGTVLVTCKKDGVQKIEVTYMPNTIYYVCLVICILTWIVLFIFKFKFIFKNIQCN